MSSDNDRIIQELKETLKQFQRQQKTRRRGRRGKFEVYCELEPEEDETARRVRNKEVDLAFKQLADISREFLKMKKVYRWHLKKVSNLCDTSVVSFCHCYVEENRLNDEWEEFRESRETY